MLSLVRSSGECFRFIEFCNRGISLVSLEDFFDNEGDCSVSTGCRVGRNLEVSLMCRVGCDSGGGGIGG